MRNMRQHRDKNIPIVQARSKRVLETSATKTQSALKSNAAFGLKNYLSKRPKGEDDVSISRHIENMKNQQDKRNKDYRLIEFAMAQTFGDRRTFIVNENPSIEMMQQQFPCLFDTYHVSF